MKTRNPYTRVLIYVSLVWAALTFALLLMKVPVGVHPLFAVPAILVLGAAWGVTTAALGTLIVQWAQARRAGRIE